MPRPFEMRLPQNIPPSQSTVAVSPEHVLGIVNQTDNAAHARISKTVQDRFTTIAKNAGWADVHFTKDAQTQHSAGAILLNPYSGIKLPDNETSPTLQIK